MSLFWKPGGHVHVTGCGGPVLISLAATCMFLCSRVGFQFAKKWYFGLCFLQDAERTGEMVILAGVAEPMSPTPAGLLSWEWAEEAVASWA